MGTKIVQVDAFTDTPFAGNPAAVCLLDSPVEETWMQRVAMEMNLSETAFLRPYRDGYELRWFTPAVEVELCGHATLAAAHALWTEYGYNAQRPIHFHTKSGLLRCSKTGEQIELDFPATPASECEPPPNLLDALGLKTATFVGETRFDNLVVVDDEELVEQLRPDFHQLALVDTRGVIVSSQSRRPDCDFISRFFAPACGINEDPVTGSAHCCLGPYWTSRLGNPALTGFQASPRGGHVHVQTCDDRVILGGEAVTTLRGELV